MGTVSGSLSRCEGVWAASNIPRRKGKRSSRNTPLGGQPSRNRDLADHQASIQARVPGLQVGACAGFVVQYLSKRTLPKYPTQVPKGSSKRMQDTRKQGLTAVYPQPLTWGGCSSSLAWSVADRAVPFADDQQGSTQGGARGVSVRWLCANAPTVPVCTLHGSDYQYLIA